MTNVLITEAGGVGAINVIKCLRADKTIRIVCVDSQEYAAGLYMGDKWYIVPRVENPGFFEFILDICEKENIDVIFPSFDAMIPVYSKNKKIFEDKGYHIIVNDMETIEIANNKYLTYQKLKGNVPILTTYSFKEIQKIGNIENLLPLIIKPIKGSGSRNVHIINSIDEFKYYTDLYKKQIQDFIFQKYADGDEYTVDMLCDFHGKLLSVVPRVRLETRAGVTYKGMTVRNPEIDLIGKKLANRMIFVGPICFQARNDTKTKEIKLFEINPRICGTVILTKEAGVNTPLLAVKLAMDMEIREDELKYEEGVVMLRYWEELYLRTEKKETN